MILDQKKTLPKCFLFIKEKAHKMAKNNCACIQGDTVYGWAIEYYGLSNTEIEKAENIENSEDDEIDEEREFIDSSKVNEKVIHKHNVGKKEKAEKNSNIDNQMNVFSFLN